MSAPSGSGDGLTEQGARFAQTWVRLFEATRHDARWVKQCVLQSLWLVVPVVGWVALFGWQRETFETGELQPAGLRRHLARGVRPFVALMVGALGPLALAGIVAVPVWLLGRRVSGYLPPELLQVPYTLWLFAAAPELLRRGFDPSATGSVQAVRSNPLAYARAVAGCFCAYVLGVMGLNLCCVGALVSVPLGHALAALFVAAWRDDVRAALRLGDRQRDGLRS